MRPWALSDLRSPPVARAHAARGAANSGFAPLRAQRMRGARRRCARRSWRAWRARWSRPRPCPSRTSAPRTSRPPRWWLRCRRWSRRALRCLTCRPTRACTCRWASTCAWPVRAARRARPRPHLLVACAPCRARAPARPVLFWTHTHHIAMQNVFASRAGAGAGVHAPGHCPAPKTNDLEHVNACRPASRPARERPLGPCTGSAPRGQAWWRRGRPAAPGRRSPPTATWTTATWRACWAARPTCSARRAPLRQLLRGAASACAVIGRVQQRRPRVQSWGC